MTDPNYILDQALEMARRAKVRLAGKSLSPEQAEHLHLAELTEELHRHIKEGGDFPREWKPF